MHIAGPTTPLAVTNGLGFSLFARHYSGSRVFFPFLRVLRCVTSPACLYPPYVFRREYARITTRGFPHSEIPGSTPVQQLPRAYRSRPRPSSTPSAKASTTSPLYLDSLCRAHLVPLCSFQGTTLTRPNRVGEVGVTVGHTTRTSSSSRGPSKPTSMLSAHCSRRGHEPADA